MHGSIWQGNTPRHCTALLLMLVLLTGCQLSESGFVRTVANAGAEFSAAANTLLYVHQGKLSSMYAASSFANYRTNLEGIDQQLPSLSGAPDTHTLKQLIAIYKPAIQAVDVPCLNTACNWRKQFHLLQEASQAFLKAAGQ